jgi:eukaryotic-like serine/threonine-protein kinase
VTLPDLAGKDGAKQYTNINFHTKGGMGEIYKGTDTTTGATVAIKLIPIINPTEEDLLSRELDISIKLTGDNIVKTHFTGKVALHSTNYLYVVQPFYGNGNIKALIKPNIPIGDCFKMITDVLNGIKQAHTLIVHRDIKPENILLDDTGNLLVSDFGLAKYINEKTRTKSFKGWGTIPYMSPECWLSETNSPSMDIYSLGILFFEFVTGILPFNGKTEVEWRDFHVYGAIPDPSLHRADLPVKLKQIINKMLQKRVGDRYKSVDEVIVSLNEAIILAGTEKAEVERLAAIGHVTVQQLQARQIEEKQEKDKVVEFKKMLNHHITELFDNIKAAANAVNSNLESIKICIEENAAIAEVQSRRLALSFSGKRITVTFPEWNLVQQYEANRIQSYRDHVKREQRIFAPQLGDSIFKKNSIILVGKFESDRSCSYGFNLLLSKGADELYGKWHVALFSDSSLTRGNRKNIALGYGELFDNFELCYSMHVLTVDYHELKDGDIHRCIEEILKP